MSHEAGPTEPTTTVYSLRGPEEHENEEDEDQERINENEQEDQYNADNKFVSLVDNPSFDEPKWGVDSLLKKFDEQIRVDEKFNFNEDEVKKTKLYFH